MKETTIGKHKVVMYDSIEDLPMVRYHRFNKFMLIDAGVGADLTDLDPKIHKVMAFLQAGDQKSAISELMNFRQSIYLLQNEITPKYLAFAALVKSVDGKDCDDISEDGLYKTIELFNDTRVGDIDKETAEVKKKLESEISVYVPDIFNDAKTKEYYQKLKQKTLLMCQALVEGRDPDEDPGVQEINTQMLLSNKPMCFQGDNSVEVRQDKDFEYACLTIAQHLNTNAKAFTVLEYYNALNYIQDLAKQQKKNSPGKGLR